MLFIQCNTMKRFLGIMVFPFTMTFLHLSQRLFAQASAYKKTALLTMKVSRQNSFRLLKYANKHLIYALTS